MLAALKSGTTLVVDRYSYSGVVFTSAKQLPGLDLSWCKVLMHCLGPLPGAQIVHAHIMPFQRMLSTMLFNITKAGVIIYYYITHKSCCKQAQAGQIS